MNTKQINDLKNKIYHYLDGRILRKAIELIISTAHSQGDYDIERRTRQVAETYSYMLRYLAQGANDPQRQDIYDNIVNDLYTFADMLVSDLRCVENPSLYFSKVRYRKSVTLKPICALVDEYRSVAADLSLFNLVLNASPSDHQKEATERAERLQAEVFTSIWCTRQLSDSDFEALSAALDDPGVSSGLKRLVVSALWMGMMEFFDKYKLRLLMLAYLKCADIDVSSMALVGMLLSLWRYKDRPLSTKTRHILMAVKEKETWARDLRIAYIELIRARDTERINRKMRDEVIPKMQRITPDMMDRISKANLETDDPMSLQENPEWQEMLEKTGVADELRELTEIQLEGGDVMMGTFAHLKGFPFFNEISNWFLPFDPANSAVRDIMASMDIVGDMMEHARFLCDSDKYSFMLSLKAVPESQRELMVSQMKAQSENIYEVMSQIDASSGSPEHRRLSVNHYVQDIYRFFKLFYRKEEFFDPFAKSIDLYNVPALADDFHDVDLLQIVAEFYFKLQYADDAISVYRLLETLTPGDAQRYQKMGYCYELKHDYSEAIVYYQRADLLDSSSNWTLRRLASCYRAAGDKASALVYYRRLAEAEPDNLRISLLYAQSLLENDQFTKALHELYKVEFLDETNHKVWRPLAWALFMTGDLDGAQRYYTRIFDEDKPSRNDYLNRGYLAIARGDIAEAVRLYSIIIRQIDGDAGVRWLIDAFDTDKPELRKAGIDTSLLPLIVEIVTQ